MLFIFVFKYFDFIIEQPPVGYSYATYPFSSIGLLLQFEVPFHIPQIFGDKFFSFLAPGNDHSAGLTVSWKPNSYCCGAVPLSRLWWKFLSQWIKATAVFLVGRQAVSNKLTIKISPVI